MTRTAVLFVDSKKRFDGRTTACALITDVPLVKRILIDLRRAGIENIFAVMDERTGEIETILDDIRRTDFKRRVFSDQQWRDEVLETGDKNILVLTADRLSDYRFLEKLAAVRQDEFAGILIAVDMKKPGEESQCERRFTPNDGKIVSPAEVASAATVRETSAYLFPAGDVIKFDGFDASYLKEKANGYLEKASAGYFDIGNGFVQEIDSKKAIREAEARLIRYIWKSTDGMHSRANKIVVLPLIKLLLRTSVTPNMVSLMGVIVSILCGYFYSKGYYLATIIGALLAYASSLLDHIDGSIARIKSKESAFGAHFDTLCDYVFYMSFGIGMAVGLFKVSNNPIYVAFGIAGLFGILISLLTATYQRKAFATNASLYGAEAHKKLESPTQNPIVRYGRKAYFVVRRPVVPYYIFFFTAINLLPFIMFMTALSPNLFWMYHLYTNKLYRPETKKLN